MLKYIWGYSLLFFEKLIYLSAMTIASVYLKLEEIIVKKNKIYTVKIVSTGKTYDEKQFFKSIFESLDIIKNLSSKLNTEDRRKEKIVIA